MGGEEGGERGEEELAAVLDLGEGDDTDGGEDATADKVRGCGKTHALGEPRGVVMIAQVGWGYHGEHERRVEADEYCGDVAV